MTKYIGKTGAQIGQPDDEISIVKDSVEEAMRELLGYSADQWPESDGEYEAVAWIESPEGDVLASEQVTINADGTRQLL